MFFTGVHGVWCVPVLPKKMEPPLTWSVTYLYYQVAQNLTFPTYDGDTMLAYAPLDSAFIYGDLLGGYALHAIFALFVF